MDDKEAATYRGLLWMQDKGYSLVRIGDSYYFCVSRAPIEGLVDFPLVTSGDVVRCGHWSSPSDAIAAVGGHF